MWTLSMMALRDSLGHITLRAAIGIEKDGVIFRRLVIPALQRRVRNLVASALR